MCIRVRNEYIPFLSEIKEIKKHTDIEYTFTFDYDGPVRPGQFFEVSLPKYGEAPISVSGIGEGAIDFTIRKVGKVTGEVFEQYIGDRPVSYTHLHQLRNGGALFAGRQ